MTPATKAGVAAFACALCACVGTAILRPALGAQPPRARPRAAVISDPADKLGGLADLLFAALSEGGRVDLVERAELKKALAEQELQLVFGAAGGRSRRRLGAVLRAGYLVLLRAAGSGKARGLELVVAETRHGYRLDRHAWKWDPGRVAAIAQEAAARVHGVLGRFAGGVTLAVAIPPFFSRNLTHRFDHLQAAYARVAELEALRRPGCVAVELEEARAIAKELATSAGDDRVARPAPHYVVGEFRHASLQADSPVTVAMRLERDSTRLAETSTAKLDAAAAVAFIRGTASEMLDRLARPRAREAPNPAKEAGALRARADGFLGVGAQEEAAALYEAALLLDPSSVPALDGAVEAYTRIVAVRLPPSPGPRRKEEDQAWHELRKRLMRRKARAVVRGSEHLSQLLRLKKYQRFYPMKRRIEGLWTAARLAADYGRAEGVDEWREVEPARRDFLIHALPRTWRPKDWADTRDLLEWVRAERWFDLVTLVGHPTWRGPGDKEWLDFRLKLFAAVYKGKTRWYGAWLTLPAEYYNGGWARRYGAEAVAKHGRLHAQFVEQFHRVCDDELGFTVAWDYARLHSQYRHDTGRPDMVVCAELRRLYHAARGADIRDGANAIHDYLETVSGRYGGVVPRYSPPPAAVTRRPPRVPQPATAGRIEVVPVEIRRFSRAGKALGAMTIAGVVACDEGTDVIWSPVTLSTMARKGRAVEIFHDLTVRITEVRWDGKWLWAATKQDKLLVLDPAKGLVRTIGPKDGIPGTSLDAAICPLGPGRVFAVGSLAPHGRAWCAVVTSAGKVDVVHEARRVAKNRKETGPDQAFRPRWVFAVRRPDGRTLDRILVGRQGFGHSKYSLLYHPLVVTLQPPKVDVVKAEFPGDRDVRSADVVQAGGFLILGGAAAKLDDMAYHLRLARQGHDGFFGARRDLLVRGGTVYIPGNTWLRVDPDTMAAKPLSGAMPSKKPHGWRIFTSRHYGILAHNRLEKNPFFQILLK